MKAHELRAVRHLALGIAEQVSALLELLDGAMPTEGQPAPETGADDMPAALRDLAEGLPPMFGAARRPPEAPAPTGATPAGTTD